MATQATTKLKETFEPSEKNKNPMKTDERRARVTLKKKELNGQGGDLPLDLKGQ